MTAVPVTRTFVAGEVVLASYFNTNINGPINFLLAPPLLRCRQTTLQTLTTGVVAALTFTPFRAIPAVPRPSTRAGIKPVAGFVTHPMPLACVWLNTVSTPRA